MTNQDQIITICVLLFIGVPLGTFTIIKTINKLTRPPVNTLVRSGDIELGDFINPTQAQPDLLASPLPLPVHTYQPINLVNPNYMNYEIYNWGDRVPSYYTGQHAPSYFPGGNPPSFHTVDRFYINSTLENNINLDFIWIMILVFIIVMILFLYNINKLLIILKTNWFYLRMLFIMIFDYIKNNFYWFDLILIPYFISIFMGLFLIFLNIIYLLFWIHL